MSFGWLHMNVAMACYEDVEAVEASHRFVEAGPQITAVRGIGPDGGGADLHRNLSVIGERPSIATLAQASMSASLMARPSPPRRL